MLATAPASQIIVDFVMSGFHVNSAVCEIVCLLIWIGNTIFMPINEMAKAPYILTYFKYETDKNQQVTNIIPNCCIK